MKHRKRLHLLILMLSAFSLLTLAQTRDEPTPPHSEPMMHLNFRESPLTHVLSLLQDLTGKTITVDLGVDAKVVLKTESRVTKQDAIELIRQALHEQGITIVDLDSNTLRVSGPPREPERTGPTYAERRAMRLQQELRTNDIVAARFTDNELRVHFINYRQDLKKAGLPQPALTEKEIELGIKIEDFQHAPPAGRGEAPRP